MAFVHKYIVSSIFHLCIEIEACQSLHFHTALHYTALHYYNQMYDTEMDTDMDHTQAFIEDLIPDLPLLMYGSGDVHPTQVDPATTELIATLTAEYIDKLVKAAVDAHDLLTDGAGGSLPPPSFEKKLEDDWSAPLPMPTIKKTKTKTKTTDVKTKTNGQSQSQSQSNSGKPRELEQEKELIKGIDFYKDRIRSTHNSVPSAINAQSFIFPICHDAEIYNKVKDNESFKAEIDRELIDSSIIDFIRDETDGGDHLAASVFHWVGVHASSSSAAAASATATAAAASSEGQGQGQGGQQSEEGKLAQERSLAKRKEMVRRLKARTKLDVTLPGLKDLLLPMHTTEDFDFSVDIRSSSSSSSSSSSPVSVPVSVPPPSKIEKSSS